MSSSQNSENMTVSELIYRLGDPRCDTAVINLVKIIPDQQVYQLLPQLVVAGPGGLQLNPIVDFNGDGVVETHETRAALIVAAQIARSHGLRGLNDIRLEQVDHRQACEIMGQISGEGAQACPAPARTR